MATANSGAFRREPGDWSCQQCNEINFKSRTTCRRCSTTRNQATNINSTDTNPQNVPKPGDWNCRYCNITNFASRNVCFKCNRQKQELTGSNNQSPVISKPNDWICNFCYNNNFASRTACNKCNRPKPVAMQIDASPQATVKPGDWKCQSCPEMNFGSRVVCRACGAARQSTETNNTNNKSECVICMDKPIDSVITTCGHSAVCLECSGSLTQCPICRNPFNQQQIIKLYNVH